MLSRSEQSLDPHPAPHSRLLIVFSEGSGPGEITQVHAVHAWRRASRARLITVYRADHIRARAPQAPVRHGLTWHGDVHLPLMRRRIAGGLTWEVTTRAALPVKGDGRTRGRLPREGAPTKPQRKSPLRSLFQAMCFLLIAEERLCQRRLPELAIGRLSRVTLRDDADHAALD